MRVPREQTDIVIFRLPLSECTKLDTQKSPVVGIRSRNQFARKLILDFLENKLVYLNQSHRLANPSLSKE